MINLTKDKPRLYLDLDGVMADFDMGFWRTFGRTQHDLADATMWKMIHGATNFFENLPVFDGALDFYREVEHLHPIILTAAPANNFRSVALQKKAWVAKHLSPDLFVIPVRGGANKCLYLHKAGDILIDDYEKNLIPWRAMGGVGVHHVDFGQTRFYLWGH